ncbi:MAG: Mth938-like domain-containing protein [Gemmobacter sp.]|nr:Mth938-like domain-containing protein [Gemmobacter sp.]
MKLTEVAFGASRPVDGYGPGFFRVAGVAHQGPVAVLPGGAVVWGGYDDTATLLAHAATLDVVFIGTGAEIAQVPAAFRAALENAGVGVEVMNSPAACRTYNVCLSEGRRIAAALLPV